MGEAIISRAGGGSGSDVVVPITPGYHTVLVTLMSNGGRKLGNAEIRCKDGNKWFNYTTNENGQALFATNSGTLYFFANSVFTNNLVMIDQKNIENYKYDAPVGVSSKLNLKMGGISIGGNIFFNRIGNSTSNQYRIAPYFDSSSNYQFIDTSVVDVKVGGGGGGGSSGNQGVIGAGGGGGEAKTVTDTPVSKETNYRGWIGKGGTGGMSNDNYPNSVTNAYGGTIRPGNTGGTSTFLGVLANGGGGGSIFGVCGIAGNGGWFGNGGGYNSNTSPRNILYPSNSNDRLYGGGGGIFDEYEKYRDDGDWYYNSNVNCWGSSPYGARGATKNNYAWEAQDASINGGGGGAGWSGGQVSHTWSNGKTETYTNFHHGGNGAPGIIYIVRKK